MPFGFPDLPTMVGLVSLPLGFAIFIYVMRVLNLWGAVAAFLLGFLIIWATDLRWLLVLLSMLGLASFATRYRYHEKVKRGLQEGDEGERKTANVLYNGVVPLVLAISIPWVPWDRPVAAVLYLSAIAVVASDTLASEIGSLADRTVLITKPWRTVPPGTDGGVSGVGQVAALAGGAVVGVVGAIAMTEIPVTPVGVAVPAVAGFLGCQVDSVLGATVESREVVNKGEVNMISTLVGALLALGTWHLLPRLAMLPI